MPTSSQSWDRETLPQGEEKRQAVREMFDAIAPRYDLVNRVMTFRLDVRWRRRTVRELALPAGSTVLDLASGTGRRRMSPCTRGTPERSAASIPNDRSTEIGS